MRIAFGRALDAKGYPADRNTHQRLRTPDLPQGTRKCWSVTFLRALRVFVGFPAFKKLTNKARNARSRTRREDPQQP